MTVDPHELARAVARLNRRLRQERESELTPTQLSVLGTIRTIGADGATPGAIAARERVQPPSVTRTLASLADAGLVDRVPHPDDGRQVLVSISAKGELVLEAERERRDEWLAHRLDSLSAPERAVLGEATVLLERLAES